jgi:hypothetical protein
VARGQRHAPNSLGNSLDNMSANSNAGQGHRFCNAGFTTGSDLDPKSGASPLMDAYGRTTEQAAQRHNVQRRRHQSSRDSVTWAATLLARPEALVCE